MNEPRARTGDALDDQVLSHVGLIRHVGQASLRGQHDLDDGCHVRQVDSQSGRCRRHGVKGKPHGFAGDYRRDRLELHPAPLQPQELLQILLDALPLG